MLRIENATGLGRDTKITNAETGEDITKLLAINYGATIEIGQMVTCRAEISMIDATVDRAVFETKNPITGNYQPVAAIEFRDGSRVEIAEDGTLTTRAAA